jgi:hypothetical protein
VDGNASARAVLSWQIDVSGPKREDGPYFRNYLPCCELPQAQQIVVAALQDGGTNWETRGGDLHHVTNNNPNTYSGFLETSGAIATGRVLWTLGSTVVSLPIELLYFRAQPKEKAVQLTWATAKEVNNDYFTVERSTDGQSFSDLLRVEGAGNSQEMRQYTALDGSPYSGVTYYRLKQTDYDGNFSYSKVEVVHSGKDGSGLQVYQPEYGQLQVSYQLPSEENGILRVYDSRGVQVWAKGVTPSSGAGRELIGLGAVRGLYIVSLQTKGGTLTQKVVVY